MNCFVGLDIGTSAIKCVLISEHGQIFGHAKKKISYLHTPNTAVVEFNVEERYNEICQLIKEVSYKKPGKATIIAICISGASGNALLLDRQKKPIKNAVSWLDNRAELTFETLLSSFPSHYVHSVCGWPKIGAFPLAYFSWMKSNEIDTYYSAEYYITDFIYYNYRFSNNFVIDTSTATNFYLQDQVKMDYHQPFLDFLQIKKENLPRIVKSGAQIGTITLQASLETNLPKGTAVIAGSFDHPSAARGTGMTEVGDLLLSCGTSWVGFFPITFREKALSEQLLIDPFLSPDSSWGAMFSFTAIGNIINEYIGLLFNNSTKEYNEFEKAVMAGGVRKNKFYFDLLQKDIPSNEYLQKISKEHTIPAICASIVESVTSLLFERITHLHKSGLTFNRISMVGGFSESKLWSQAIANKFNLPIHFILGEYAGCYGATILAGIGVGLFENELDGFNQLNIKYNIITPN